MKMLCVSATALCATWCLNHKCFYTGHHKQALSKISSLCKDFIFHWAFPFPRHSFAICPVHCSTAAGLSVKPNSLTLHGVGESYCCTACICIVQLLLDVGVLEHLKSCQLEVCLLTLAWFSGHGQGMKHDLGKTRHGWWRMRHGPLLWVGGQVCAGRVCDLIGFVYSI